MSETNVVLFGYGKQMNCSCSSDDAILNYLRNFDADFGLSKCMVKNAGETVVRFAREHFGESPCYEVKETEDGLLVSFVA